MKITGKPKEKSDPDWSVQKVILFIHKSSLLKDDSETDINIVNRKKECLKKG